MEQNKIWDVIIVGAGASGLLAGIMAARNGCGVQILEHMSEPAKKILVTGNGKCNFANTKLGLEFYRGDQPEFIKAALEQFDVTQTLDFFDQLGITAKVNKGGYYPASQQAASVRDALLSECRRLKISMLCDVGIREITKQQDRFVFDTKTGNIESRCCILTTGGKSAKKTGSDGSGYSYAKQMGHSMVEPTPALVPLLSELAFFKETAGIRAEVKAEIYVEQEKKDTSFGELQITDYGISGICIFQLSHYAAPALKKGKKVEVILDFLPKRENQELQEKFWFRFHNPCAEEKSAKEALNGLWPEKLIPEFLKASGLPLDYRAADMTREDIKKLLNLVRNFKVPVTGTKSFDFSQVTAGGVVVSEVNQNTMESRLVPGLFFAGELLDLDGVCGGYNLQWAWSSGALAGRQAAKQIQLQKKQSGKRKNKGVPDIPGFLR